MLRGYKKEKGSYKYFIFFMILLGMSVTIFQSKIPIEGTFCIDENLPKNQIYISFLRDEKFFLKISEAEQVKGTYHLTNIAEVDIIELSWGGDSEMFGVYDLKDDVHLCIPDCGVISLRRISKNAILN